MKVTYLLEKSAAHVQQMHHKPTQLPDCFMSTRKSSPHVIRRWTQPVVIAAENTKHREKQSRVNFSNFLPEASYGLRVLSLPASVCVCVCVYVCVCVRQSSVCPDDNLSPAQATITKFGPEVQNTLIKIPIVFGVHWPWPSRSNWT